MVQRKLLGSLLVALSVGTSVLACGSQKCEPKDSEDTDLAEYYPELRLPSDGGATDAGATPSELDYAAKQRQTAGYPDDLAAFLAEPCEKTCRSRWYDGSSLTSCRPPEKTSSGSYNLHCEWVYHGCIGPNVVPS